MRTPRVASPILAYLVAVGPLALLLLAGCPGGDSGDVVCEPACPGGTHCTADGCVSDDPSKGPLDFATPPVDMAGCLPACAAPTPYCRDSRCVACLEDKNCPNGQICKTVGPSSICVPGCSDDARCGGGTMKCCAGACADTGKDPQNCGACGMACGTQNSRATCTGGACVPGACNSGWGDCNGNPADGCEVNLRADPKNCTICGNVCSIANAVTGCSDTDMPPCYIAACKFGYDDCNGETKDGCETSVLSDAKNCGGCGTVCGAKPNAQVKCINASCAVTMCNIGYADCNGNGNDGCEVVLNTDVKNCGACGSVCPQGQICVNGGCTCGNCNIPNAKTKCVNNQCLFDGCAPGYADCDNNQGNGCEINIGNDAMNCGACGMACPAMQVCSQGNCMKCGNDCWGAAGCLTGQGKCIQFTCRPGNGGANFCNGCKGWKEVTYDQWMNQGYCADVIARYRVSDQATTHCGNAAACCGSSQACAGGDNAWHLWNAQQNSTYFVGPALGNINDVNCRTWNNADNSAYTRITVCEQ